MQAERYSEHGDHVSRSSRAAFLRKLGKTVAIGLGVALVPASNAWAISAHCCPDATCGQCPEGQTAWKCYECSGYQPSQCCTCENFGGNCRYQLGCGVCGGP